MGASARPSGRHPRRERADRAGPGTARSFAADGGCSRHVVAHGIGDAFLREVDISILGPEEAIAEDFATVYVQMTFPERDEAIAAASADQNLADGEDAGRFSEYADDDQRAERSVCVLYRLDPERYEALRKRYGLSEDEAAS